MSATTQSTAVPVADKSAARKPLIIAGITILVLVAVTLSLFFVDIQTAGKAIATGKASLNQGGIFLDDATEELGTVLSVPIKVNIGNKKSVSFEFDFQYGSSLSDVGDEMVSLEPIADLLVPDELNSVVVESTNIFDVNTRTGVVRVAWLCADADCTNALTGEMVIAHLRLVGIAEGIGALKFTSFNVYDLASNDDLIKDGAGTDITLSKKAAPPDAVCAAGSLSSCTDQPSCSAVAGLWYKNACISICPAPAGVDRVVAVDDVTEYQTCILPAAPCNKNDPASCTTANNCNQVGLLWTEATRVCSACAVGTDFDPNSKSCKPAAGVCDARSLSSCTDQPSCSAVAGLWYINACISACPAPAGIGLAVAEDGVTEYQTCILPAAECNKNDPASCKTGDACNKVGLLWTEATRVCAVCAAGTEFDPDSKSCVAVTKKKIKIEVLDLNKNLVAKAAKLKAKDKYTVKVTIAPEKVLPADHLVLVKISYGSVVKTTFVDKKAGVDVNGEEKVEFTHDVAPEFKGNMTVDVFVWNNWPSLSGIWEALLPEGGNEQEGGSVTYAVE